MNLLPFTLQDLIHLNEDGIYTCVLCNRDDLPDRVAAEAHLILYHPRADRALRKTIDKFTDWYFLVYSRANPEEKPPSYFGSHWLPVVWGVVEVRNGIPKALDIIPYRPKHPGSVKDMGMTVLCQVAVEDRDKVREYAAGSGYWNKHGGQPSSYYSWNYGIEAGDWIWRKLKGRTWGVVAKLEIEAWLVNKVQEGQSARARMRR